MTSVPLSPRLREREDLKGLSFCHDPLAVETLEAAVCAYHGCAHAVAFQTPEAALVAVLAVTGVGNGDAVLAASMAPLYHFSALRQRGAELRFADIGLDGVVDTKRLSPDQAASVKTILFGAFGGNRAERAGVPEAVEAIEDLGNSLAPRAVSGLSLWSLEALMPEGLAKTGFVLTDDADTAQRLKAYGKQGYRKGSLWNYDIVSDGADTVLDGFAAAVALHQFRQIDAALEHSREHIARLDARLGGNRLFDLLRRSGEAVPEVYSVLLTPQLYCPKEDIFTALTDKGIETGVCCKPIYKTSRFKNAEVRLPVSEEFYKALLQLPCHHRLSPTEVDAVAEEFLAAVDVYAYRGCRF